ncbi:MAG: hypothetical protein II832_07670 [Synergistaceae bacterium]|nr:hypothetical protein [Synergistaceae bacterium]MBQ6971566.1 hypothetical protein [Synergistaceae bacterium]
MADSLSKVFRVNPNAHNSEYAARFSSVSAVHLPLMIRQYNHEREYQAFFYYSQDLAMLMEKIYTGFTDFTRTLQNVSNIVLQQFALASLIDEVQSTSEIEGIHSTHRELREILYGETKRAHFSSIIRKYEFSWREVFRVSYRAGM